jgi:hypothetical protein
MTIKIRIAAPIFLAFAAKLGFIVMRVLRTGSSD